MDFTRIEFIHTSSLENLKNSHYIEHLMVVLGFNTESLDEQPPIVRENGGGLRIWKYPNQFSKYLAFLSTLSITSYIELGCRWGGAFVLTNEYLKRFHPMDRSVAVDSIDTPVLEYCLSNPETLFIQTDVRNDTFKTYMKSNHFDLIFINGDYLYEGVKANYETCKDRGNIFVFHNITNDACMGVVHFWNELKAKESDTYDFFEFTEQYEEVWYTMYQRFLGIGVAIKRTP